MKGSIVRHLSFPLAIAVVLMYVAGLSCTGSPEAASPGITARYSYHWAPGHQLAKYSEEFARLCRQETGGSLAVATYPSGQLYGSRDAIAAVSQGSVEIAAVTALTLTSADPSFGTDSLFMLFDNYDQQRSVWQTEPGRAVVSRVEQKLGVRLICRLPNGPACFFTSDRRVEKLADFKGLKARFVSPSEKPFWEAIGASSVSLSTEEVYTALQQHMVEAVTTVTSAIKGYAWWDIIRYGTLPYVAYPDSFIVVNAAWWNSLPKGVSETVLKKVVPGIEADSTKSVMDDSQAGMDEFVKLKNGTVFNLSASDVKAMREICATKVYPDLTAKYDPAFWEAVVKLQGLRK